MKRFSLLLPIITLVFMLSSCGKDKCETCTVLQVSKENGVEIASQELNTNQEFCGDALDEIITETTVTCE